MESLSAVLQTCLKNIEDDSAKAVPMKKRWSLPGDEDEGSERTRRSKRTLNIVSVSSLRSSDSDSISVDVEEEEIERSSERSEREKMMATRKFGRGMGWTEKEDAIALAIGERMLVMHNKCTPSVINKYLASQPPELISRSTNAIYKRYRRIEKERSLGSKKKRKRKEGEKERADSEEKANSSQDTSSNEDRKTARKEPKSASAFVDLQPRPGTFMSRKFTRNVDVISFEEDNTENNNAASKREVKVEGVKGKAGEAEEDLSSSATPEKGERKAIPAKGEENSNAKTSPAELFSAASAQEPVTPEAEFGGFTFDEEEEEEEGVSLESKAKKRQKTKDDSRQGEMFRTGFPWTEEEEENCWKLRMELLSRYGKDSLKICAQHLENVGNASGRSANANYEKYRKILKEQLVMEKEQRTTGGEEKKRNVERVGGRERSVWLLESAVGAE